MAQHDLPGAPPRCLSNIQPWHAQMHYGQQPYFEHPAVNSPSASCRAHSISSTSVRLPTSTLILKAVAPSKFVSVLSITMSLHGGRKRRLYMDSPRHLQFRMYLAWYIVPRLSVCVTATITKSEYPHSRISVSISSISTASCCDLRGKEPP